MDPHAQQEIRDYANAMFALIQPIVPIAAEAFLDYNFQSMHLSRLEIEAIRTGQPLATENKREPAEWEEKKRMLGLKSPEGRRLMSGPVFGVNYPRNARRPDTRRIPEFHQTGSGIVPPMRLWVQRSG